MKIACCTWALSGPEDQVLGQLADIGFRWVDIQPSALRSAQSQATAQRLGLGVSCVGLAFGLPEGDALDHADATVRVRALAHARAGLDHAAQLGAATAYIIPGLDTEPAALDQFARVVRQIADSAAERGIRLAIEHFPGRALPTIAGTLDFVQEVGHPNFGLLLDIGHAQMSSEDAAAAIVHAGPLLAYVHLDDNDGVDDLHWALLDGVLTVDSLRATLAALREIGYDGGVSLELNPSLPDPLDAVKRSWQVVQDVLHAQH